MIRLHSAPVPGFNIRTPGCLVLYADLKRVFHVASGLAKMGVTKHNRNDASFRSLMNQDPNSGNSHEPLKH